MKELMTKCDSCTTPIPAGEGALLRMNWADARKGSKVADLCNECGEKIPGLPKKRRGRRPREAVRSLDTLPH